MFGITIITNKRLEQICAEEYENGIQLRKYVNGIKRGAILNPDKVLEEIMKAKEASNEIN